MANDLITSDSSILLHQIHDAVDVEQVRKMIKQLDAVKVALESINRFHEKSIIYAQLEAEALIRLIELGGIKYLRGYKRQTAEWLSKMDNQDRDKYINMCKDGLTITAIFQRETGTYMHYKKYDPSPGCLMEEERSRIMDTAIEGDDPVDLTLFASHARESYGTEDEANDAIDGMRNKLRKLNYVSVGDKSGKYVPVKNSNDQELWGAVRCRVHGIIDDIQRISEICKEANLTFGSADFIYGNWEYQREIADVMRCVLMALKCAGVLTEVEKYDSFILERN